MRSIFTKLLKRKLGERWIRLDSIVVDRSEVTYEYSYSDNLKKFFSEYSFSIDFNIDVENIPEGVLTIPFVSNTATIAWILDATLVVESLDEDFYRCLATIKDGYRTVHPKVEFGGNIIVSRKSKNKAEDLRGSAVAFSGGVDSYNTLLNHIDEAPRLVTLVGSDIFFDDKEGIEMLSKNTLEAAAHYGVDSSIIFSRFRYFLNEYEFDKIVEPIVGDGWWHGFQHSLGIIGHIAPIAYVHRIRKFYFASTYTEAEFHQGLSMASYPIIDNNITFFGVQVQHDAFSHTRQQKIQNIHKYSCDNNTQVKLRVCWRSKGGKNCSECEKCYRTIVALIVDGANPEEYGFEVTADISPRARRVVKDLVGDEITLAWWCQISSAAKANKEFVVTHPEFEWLVTLD